MRSLLEVSVGCHLLISVGGDLSIRHVSEGGAHSLDLSDSLQGSELLFLKNTDLIHDSKHLVIDVAELNFDLRAIRATAGIALNSLSVTRLKVRSGAEDTVLELFSHVGESKHKFFRDCGMSGGIDKGTALLARFTNSGQFLVVHFGGNYDLIGHKGSNLVHLGVVVKHTDQAHVGVVSA